MLTITTFEDRLDQSLSKLATLQVMLESLPMHNASHDEQRFVKFVVYPQMKALLTLAGELFEVK